MHKELFDQEKTSGFSFNFVLLASVPLHCTPAFLIMAMRGVVLSPGHEGVRSTEG